MIAGATKPTQPAGAPIAKSATPIPASTSNIGRRGLPTKGLPATPQAKVATPAKAVHPTSPEGSKAARNNGVAIKTSNIPRT